MGMEPRNEMAEDGNYILNRSQEMLEFLAKVLIIVDLLVPLQSQTHNELPCIRLERAKEGALHFELRTVR